MGCKLSILIPALISRYDNNVVLKQLNAQNLTDIEVLVYYDNGELSIGEKRNKLLKSANGEYLCFIDDDDSISNNFIKYIMDGINKDVDCCSLRGVITWDGGNPEIFEHSIKYKEYATTDNPIKYERYPNHLNVIKASIAKQFKFPEINHGEDTDWATQIFKSGLIKTEHYIPEVIYNYNYITNK